MRSGYLNPAVEILVSRILFFITAIYFIKNLNIEREKKGNCLPHTIEKYFLLELYWLFELYLCRLTPLNLSGLIAL